MIDMMIWFWHTNDMIWFEVFVCMMYESYESFDTTTIIDNWNDNMIIITIFEMEMIYDMWHWHMW